MQNYYETKLKILEDEHHAEEWAQQKTLTFKRMNNLPKSSLTLRVGNKVTMKYANLK